MRASFQAVSKELEEAAFLDGAGPFTAFLWVTLPLALPSIAVAALVAFLVGYTEFAIGWLFIESSENVTLAMAISGIIGQLGGSGASPGSIGNPDEPTGGNYLLIIAALPDRPPAHRKCRNLII